MKAITKVLMTFITAIHMLCLQVATPMALTQSILTSSLIYSSHSIANEITDVSDDTETASSSGVTDVSDADSEQMTAEYKGLEDESKASMMTFIVMLITGFLAASLMMCEKKSIDMMVAAAGGAIYILSEVMQFFQSKAKFEQEAVEYNVTTSGAPDLSESQREALESQKVGYMEAKKAAENKGKFQLAAAVAFFAAAGIGITLGIMEKSSAASCVSGAAAESTTNPSCPAAASAATAQQAQAEAPKDSAIDTSNNTQTAAVTAPCASCGFFGNMIVKSSGACSNLKVAYSDLDVNAPNNFLVHWDHHNNLKQKMCLAGDEETQSLTNSSLLNNTLGSIAELIIPSAQAKKMSPLVTLFGGLGGGVAIVMLLKKKLGKVLDFMVGTPLKRGIAFGALGALALATSKLQKEVAEKMQQNVDDIQALLNRFDNLQGSRAAVDSAINQGSGGLTSIPLRTGIPIGSEGQAYPCISTNGEKKCISTKSLIDAGLQTANVDIPSGLTGISGVAGSTADAISGQTSLSQGAVDGVNSLASGLNAVNKINRALKKKLNDDLKNQGKNPIDFAKKEAGFMDSLKGSLLKTLQKNNLTPSSALAGISPAAAGAIAAVDEKKSKKPTPVLAAITKPAVSPTRRNNSGFSLDLGGSDELKLDSRSNRASPSGLSNSSDDLLGQDIVDDPDADIFKVISVRYLKSGYPRILKRK